jgi:putative transposase
MYYGPEFPGEIFVNWREANGVTIEYIELGKPTQNAYIERFNRSLRNGLQDLYRLRNFQQVRELMSRWRKPCNEHRPHDVLGGIPPAFYAQRLLDNSSYGLSTFRRSLRIQKLALAA